MAGRDEMLEEELLGDFVFVGARLSYDSGGCRSACARTSARACIAPCSACDSRGLILEDEVGEVAVASASLAEPDAALAAGDTLVAALLRFA